MISWKVRLVLSDVALNTSLVSFVCGAIHGKIVPWMLITGFFLGLSLWLQLNVIQMTLSRMWLGQTRQAPSRTPPTE